MTTEYTRSVTIACPSAGMADANHLALLLGESSADIETFRTASYTDGILPPDPLDPMPEGYSRDAAQRAFESLNTPGGIQMAVDVDPHEQFAAWGLVRIPQEHDI